MTAYQKLHAGIGRAAWGYFFIYFDININTVSILPDFAGYLLFLSAIGLLRDEERELDLLRTPGIILAVWHGFSWLAGWASAGLDGRIPALDILIGVVNIYFHFQLLTNLASIAGRYQPEGDTLDGKLLCYRTLQTLMLTAAALLGYFANRFGGFGIFLSVCTVVVYMIAGILLMRALFRLRRCLGCF